MKKPARSSDEYHQKLRREYRWRKARKWAKDIFAVLVFLFIVLIVSFGLYLELNDEFNLNSFDDDKQHQMECIRRHSRNPNMTPRLLEQLCEEDDPLWD